MKLLYDFFPVLLFFGVYKFYSAIPADIIAPLNRLPLLQLQAGQASDAIFLATAVAIVASFMQLALYWLRYRQFQRMHVISLAIITLAGGATLLFRDPVFIKWKPTLINGIFALVFLGSQWFGSQSIAERLMSHAITVPRTIWNRLNLGWVGFFIVSALANLYVAYHFSEETWVDFKLFGLLGLTLVFVIGQSIYLARYMQVDDEIDHKGN